MFDNDSLDNPDEPVADDTDDMCVKCVSVVDRPNGFQIRKGCLYSCHFGIDLFFLDLSLEQEV